MLERLARWESEYSVLGCLLPLQEICLCDPPVVMALVDGPTGENDNMICVAYKHQFDLINESTGDAYRLHHVEANRVRCLGTHTHTHKPYRQ